MRIIEHIKNIYSGIIRIFSNIWIYRKFLWNDYWFDHVYFFDMMKTKLENMRDNFYNGMTLSAPKKAEKMDLCVKLLDRIIEDVYFEMYFDPHDKKWGEYRIIEDPTFLICERKNVITEEDKEQQSKEFMEVFEKIEKQRQQDIDYLFKILRKHILTWWD